MDEALLLCYEQVTRTFLEKRLHKEFDINNPVFINGTGSSYVQEYSTIDMREFCVVCDIPHDVHYLFRNLLINYIWNTPSGKCNWYPILRRGSALYVLCQMCLCPGSYVA